MVVTGQASLANAGLRDMQSRLVSLFTELLFENVVDCHQEAVALQVHRHRVVIEDRNKFRSGIL